MYSIELYRMYIKKTNERYALENKINEYIEMWKKGEISLSTEQVEQIIEKSNERLEYLKSVEELIHNDFMQMSNLEERKKLEDAGISSALGHAPTNINNAGGILSPDASKSHFVAEKKTPEQLNLEKQKMKKEIKEKLISNKITLAQAMDLSKKVDELFDFYNKKDEIQGRHI